MNKLIYLDHHATTPLDPRVLDAMLPFFIEQFGNPSSPDHIFGWEAEAAVKQARREVAQFIGGEPEEIIFTSGATESSALAWFGLANFQSAASHEPKPHFITTAIEHASILANATLAQSLGAEITILPVDSEGRVKPKQVEAAIRATTTLVSIQFANNEVGTLQPIAEIGEICKKKSVYFHSDAAQAGAWNAMDVNTLGVDLLSLSAHKMSGPKGIGALYMRKKNPRVDLRPLIPGGHHENGIRPGTLNVPGIVGFGKACEIARQERNEDHLRVSKLRDELWENIHALYPEAIQNGCLGHRLSNNLHVTLPGIEAETFIRKLNSVAISTGAACSANKRSPSHVLKAMGLDANAIHSSLRFGLGKTTTSTDIKEASRSIQAALAKEEGIWARI